MELLSITLAANETKQFAKAGRYFEIIDSGYALTVNFTGANGAQSDSMVNALSGLYLEDAYAAFSVTNGPAAQSVTMLLMETGRGGSRRQPGNVRVIDSNADKTLLSKQFIGTIGAGASPGVFSVVGLNPNAARISIKRIAVSSATSGVVNVLFGTGAGTAMGFVAYQKNKLVNAALSVSSMTNGTTAAILPTAGEVPGAAFGPGFYIPANTLTEIPLSTPLILQAGAVLIVSGGVANRDIAALFDSEEL